MEVYYDSWDLSYKRPFGAVIVNTTVDFYIHCQLPGNIKMFLILQKENENPEVLEMIRCAESQFNVHHTINKGKGLYFYYFQINQETEDGVRLYYYGQQEFGGEGTLVHDIDHLTPYQLTCFDQIDDAPQWYRKGVAYQIFPDRFFNGNENGLINHPRKNTFIYATPEDDPIYVKNEKQEIIRWDFFGGNLSGIEKKIPYLKDLGVTILYLNPIFRASSNHRYDTDDYLEIDSILGTYEDFLSLTEKLHEAGIRVILDGVFSHVGWNSRYFNRNKQFGDDQGAYNDPNSPYYPWFNFREYPEDYRAWWGVKDLPVLNKQNASFQKFIYGDQQDSVLSKWTPLVDGWRLDVADELPDFFIKNIRKKVDSYQDKVLIGEVWEDASNKISYDQRREYILGNHLHGVMNYPLRQDILDFLHGNSSAERVCRHLETLKENYPKAAFYNSFNNLGTHDTERILTLLNHDKNSLDLAIGFMFVMPGTPCIYYGDEAGLTGGKDPENRKFFPWGREDTDIQSLFKKWIKLRKQFDAFQSGELEVCYFDDLLGIVRYTEDDFVFYIMNPTDKDCKLNGSDLKFLRKNPLIQSELNTIKDQTILAQDYHLMTGKIDTVLE